MSQSYWEHYSHPADMGIRGIGPTIEASFEQAGLALTAIIADLQTIEPKEKAEINCEEQDNEILFVSWLNALLYVMATRKMLFSRFEIKINNGQLNAKAWGEKLNVKKHKPTVEVKAATYADLKVVKNREDKWIAQCIVDV
jgi:SHS2 domain-containing protein